MPQQVFCLWQLWKHQLWHHWLGKKRTSFEFPFLLSFIFFCKKNNSSVVICVCSQFNGLRVNRNTQTLFFFTVWTQIQASGVHEDEGWLLGCIFLQLPSSLILASLYSLIDMHPLTQLRPGTYTQKKTIQAHRHAPAGRPGFLQIRAITGSLPPSKISRRPLSWAARQEPSNHTNKVSRQCELLWRVSVLFQEEPPTTGLTPLIRCQRCSAPRWENNHAAHTEGCCSDQDAGIETATGPGFFFFTQNTPASSAYSESQSRAATENSIPSLPEILWMLVDYFAQIGDGWQHEMFSTHR